MPGAPAYRYDYASAQPLELPKQRHHAPSVTVVPGRKHENSPRISDAQVLFIKILLTCLAVFLVVGIVRVGLASAAYITSSSSNDLSTEITAMRNDGQALEVQKSTILNPSNLKTIAAEDLSMSAPTTVTTMSLGKDVVQFGDAGELSLAGSLSALASMG